jgi:hypothetical protein
LVFDRKGFCKSIIENVKRTMVRSGQDHAPMFFVVRNDGEVVAVGAQWDSVESKEKVVEALRGFVEEVGSELYYMVAPSWLENRIESVQELKRLVGKKPTKARVALAKRICAGMQAPSESPFRRQILLFEEFSKSEGSQAWIVPYEKVRGKFRFERLKLVDEKGSSYSRFNVWHQHQVEG